MIMKRYRTPLIILASVVLTACLAWLAYSLFFVGPPAKVYTHIPGGEMRHANARAGFSFAIPDGLTAQEGKYGSEEVRYVRLRDESNAIALMLIVTPTEADVSTYSLADSRADAPRVVMAEAAAMEPLPGTEGISFESRNPLWPTATSTEVWFRHAGYRYQLATPNDQALIDFVLRTWRFDVMNLPLTAPVGS